MADLRKIAMIYAAMGILGGPDVYPIRQSADHWDDFDRLPSPTPLERTHPVNPKKSAHRAKVKAARKQKHGRKR